MKRYLKPINLLWLGLIALIFFAIRVFPWQEILQTLRSLTMAEIVILLALNLVILLVFSLRWWLLLRAYGYKLPYLKLSGYRIAGFAISYFTPGTQFGGEPLQIYLVHSRHEVPSSQSVAAVVLDKIIDLFVNFSFMALGILVIFIFGLIPGLSRPDLAGLIGLLLLLPVGYAGILLTGRLPASSLIERLPSRLWLQRTLRKLPPLIKSAEIQIGDLLRRRPWFLLWTLFLSIIVWILMVFEYWLMVYFLGGHLSLPQAIGGYTAARVSFLVPLPGGFGALEASQALAMQAFGYTTALGISLSLLMRARDLVVGLFGLWVGGVTGVRSAGKPEYKEEVTLGLLEPEIVRAGD